MKTILAIETSVTGCSVALSYQSNVTEIVAEESQQQSRLILGMIDQLLSAQQLKIQDLDVIAVTVGPGSFTGVRIGVAAVQGLAQAANIPVMPVSTLRLLAFMAKNGEYPIAVAQDARQNEAYVGLYSVGSIISSADAEECLIKLESIDLSSSKAWIGVGSGWQKQVSSELIDINEKFIKIHDQLLPKAGALASLCTELLEAGVEPVTYGELAPNYIRHNVVG